MPDDHSSNSVVTQFENEWREGGRPWIFAALAEVDNEHRTQVLPQLLSIDIRHRASAGETVRPNDYLQLGPEAVQTVQQFLTEVSRSIYSDQDLAITAPDSRTDNQADATVGLIEVKSDGSFSDGSSRFIGPYELIEPIGEGGMGTVWLAQQHEPVRRKVALKVIRGEIDSQAAISRFEAERQAIALMDHQNIAKILDAGTTESGNPYFAMELVDGVPLNRYCDNNQIGMRERLELMIPVCRAIHHAHQKGIIHRDLKHSNVLVTTYDGQPVPKVIDFGLAKAFETQNKLTEETIFTEYGRVVGTLQYMSPEQAELNSMDIDTRSDIYSLGVMIYKLLTGTTPLNTEGQNAKTLVEILELIREQEPPKPSDRLASLDDAHLKKVADGHRLKPEKLLHQVRSDVDWIVMKAIEKDRDRRYQSANGMALDIDRFLNDEEVRACPPSAIYRVEKFYQRNKKLVASLSAIGIALVLGIVGTAYGWFWAMREQATAKNEADKAVEARNEAQEAQALAEARLQAIGIKSAYSDWQLGNVEAAWHGFSGLDPDDQSWESRYLQTELSSSRNVMYGHALAITSLDRSDDGRLLATVSHDNTLKVWDAINKSICWTAITQDLPNQVRFSPNSKQVAYADRSNRIVLLDAATGKRKLTLGPYGEDITSIEFLDDQTLATGTSSLDLSGFKDHLKRIANVDPVIRIFDLKSGNVDQTLTGHSKTITSIAGSPDGREIVTAGEDSTIRIWTKKEQKFSQTKVINAHYPGVNQVLVSPTGRAFASCGKDATIRFWSLNTGELIQTFVGHRESVNGICFSRDGIQIVSASADQTARIWSIEGEMLRTYQGHFEEITQVCFSADDQEFFTASEDTTIRYHRSAAKSSTLAVRTHSDVVWQTVFTPDDQRLISVGEDGVISICDPQSGQPLIAPIKLDMAILSVAHSPIDNLFVTGGADSKLRVWDSNNGELIQCFDGHDGYVWDITFSNDGQTMATASSDNTFKIWSTADWTQQHHVKAHFGELGSVRFSSDQKMLVTSGDDKKIKLWDTINYHQVGELSGHRTGVWRAIFSPTNPNLIASSSYDGQIILWDLNKRCPIRAPINAHKNQIAGLAFTSDGSRIVSASDDQSIKIWDVKTGIELFVLRDTDDSAIVATSFSSDGTKLATGNQDGWVTIRTANKHANAFQPFLPMDAIQLSQEVNSALLLNCDSDKDYAEQLKLVEKCSQHFPSYLTHSGKGIALYRLGRIEESLRALEEAQRLEPLMYGAPDLPPYIEGFLTLAYLKRGEMKKSRAVHDIFLKKSNAKIWNDSEPIPDLKREIEKTFASYPVAN